MIYLDVPIKVITDRLNADSSRPLIKNKNSIIEIFNTRKEKYLSVADYVVDASLSINCICESVTKSLNL
jgi:shikimate kinase